MPEPLVRLFWTKLRMSPWGTGEAPTLMVTVSPSLVSPLTTSVLPESVEDSLEPQAARVVAARARPREKERRVMVETMTGPFRCDAMKV